MGCTMISDQTGVDELRNVTVPVMTREAFASAVGLPAGVVIAQCDRGLWPQVKVGKRSLINVEALRIAAARKAEEFTL
jgi:hypothetical protein